MVESFFEHASGGTERIWVETSATFTGRFRLLQEGRDLIYALEVEDIKPMMITEPKSASD
jgi:hypothetical protein